MAAQSTKPKKPRKPAGFPLTANGNQQWSKVIRGRTYYFGKWEDRDGALRRYLEEKDDLLAGKKPRGDEETTLKYLVNHFLTAKREQLAQNEITQRTFDEYHKICEFVLDVSGKSRLVEDLMPDDFARLRRKWAKTLGPVALGNRIQRARVLFNHAFKECLIDRPVRYGSQFSRPAKRIVRRERLKNGAKLFTADEIHKLLAAASPAMRAMILLGVQSGFGPTDCATLRLSGVDLDRGWIDHARPKTHIQRRTPISPETVKALRDVITSRPKPTDNANRDLVFITRWGDRWVKDGDNAVSKEFGKLTKSLDLVQRGRGHYALRHVFATVGGEAKDPDAVRALMGHVDSSMMGEYREGVSDERLGAVVDCVREWLYREER